MNRDGWDVHDVRSNSTGVYYALTMRTKGTLEAMVTVKHSTRRDTMVCLTCLTADTCKHAQFARVYVQQNPTDTRE